MSDSDALVRKVNRERAARKEAEHLLEAKSRELFLANAELRLQYQELQQAQMKAVQAEKMASIGQLAAGVAHELNTPLGFIHSNLNSLREYAQELGQVFNLVNQITKGSEAEGLLKVTQKADEIDLAYVLEDLGDLVDDSLDGSRRVQQIVSDLKAASAASDATDTQPADTDLNPLLERAVRVASNATPDAVKIQLALGSVPLVRCCEGTIAQVVLNLMANAIDSLEGPGVVTLRSSADATTAWFEIEDTGRGIPKDNLNRIFDPFFTTKDVGEGTGMGLPQAYRVVEAHGGRINASSVVGKGTTFRVELPIAGIPKASDT